MTETQTEALVVRGTSGDWFYTGDLRAAKRIILSDRHPMMGIDDNFKTGVQTYKVELRERNADGAVAEFGGSAESFEEAWRYALGAYFGAEDWCAADESRLRKEVAAHASPFM